MYIYYIHIMCVHMYAYLHMCMCMYAAPIVIDNFLISTNAWVERFPFFQSTTFLWSFGKNLVVTHQKLLSYI